MKTTFKILSLLVAAFAVSFTAFSQNPDDKKIVGNWSGELELPTQNMELIFKISADSTGELTTKMDVPLQGAKDLPVQFYTSHETELQFCGLTTGVLAARAGM
jgi:hypothetical protein